MDDYSNFPPLNCFKRVLLNSPESALIYATIWSKKKSKQISIRKNDLKRSFFISPTLFRNHLIALGNNDLVSFEETSDFFLIDFYENDKK